jgi:hypothetical protein
MKSSLLLIVGLIGVLSCVIARAVAPAPQFDTFIDPEAARFLDLGFKKHSAEQKAKAAAIKLYFVFHWPDGTQVSPVLSAERVKFESQGWVRFEACCVAWDP